MTPLILSAVAEDGAAMVTDAAADVVSGAQGYSGGFVCGTFEAVADSDVFTNAARYTEGGAIRLYDATSAVPSGAVVSGGCAYTEDGQLCVTSEDVPAGASFLGGVAVRSDGAVYVDSQQSFILPLQSSAVPTFAQGDYDSTFTRATTKYVIDWEGVYRQLASGEIGFTGARRVRNLAPTKSEDFSNAAWTKGGTATVTGTNVINFPADSDTLRGEIAASGTYSGRAFVARFDITKGTGESIRFYFRDGDAGTVFGDVTLNLQEGRHVYSIAATPNSQTNNLQVVLRRPSSGTQASQFTLHNIQAQDKTGASDATVPDDYVSVGVESAPYFGCGIDGVKCFNTTNGNTVTDNVVTEATGAPITNANSDYADASGPFGYNAEVARTNSALHSRKLAAGVTATAWVESNITAADDATGVDGVANACSTLTATADNGTILQAITLASAAAVFQPFVKRKTGTGTIEITLNGGTNWTDITAAVDAAAPDWYRLAAVTATLANPSIGYRLGTSGDEIEVDMNDCQNGTFRTSPIPTTTAAVPRNADVLTYAVSGNISSTAGSVTAEVILAALTNYQQVIGSPVGDTAAYPLLVDASGRIQQYDGTNNPIWAASVAANTLTNLGASWGGTAFLAAKDGASNAGTFDGNMGLATNFQIVGGAAASGNSSMNIRFLRIYPQALSSAQLEALTA